MDEKHNLCFDIVHMLVTIKMLSYYNQEPWILFDGK